MKRGIEIWSDWDMDGKSVVHIRKAKGKFTLEEIRQILTEYMQDVYLIMIKAMEDLEDGDEGDFVECWFADQVMR